MKSYKIILCLILDLFEVSGEIPIDFIRMALGGSWGKSFRSTECILVYFWTSVCVKSGMSAGIS